MTPASHPIQEEEKVRKVEKQGGEGVSTPDLVSRFVRREPEVTRAFRFDGGFPLEILLGDQRVRKAPGGCEIVWHVQGALCPAKQTLSVSYGQWVVRDEQGLRVMNNSAFQAKYLAADS